MRTDFRLTAREIDKIAAELDADLQREKDFRELTKLLKKPVGLKGPGDVLRIRELRRALVIKGGRA